MEDSSNVAELDVHQAGASPGIKDQNGIEVQPSEKTAMEGILDPQDQAHTINNPDEQHVGQDMELGVCIYN